MVGILSILNQNQIIEMIGDDTDKAMTENNQKRLRILAVDDHQVMLTLYREALSFKGG